MNILPEKLYFGLKMFDKGKPNIKLFSFQNDNGYNIGYENIKSGGRVLWITERNREIAEKKVVKWLQRYNLA